MDEETTHLVGNLVAAVVLLGARGRLAPRRPLGSLCCLGGEHGGREVNRAGEGARGGRSSSGSSWTWPRLCCNGGPNYGSLGARIGGVGEG